MNIRSYANAQLRIFLSFCLFTAFGASFRHRQNFRLTGLSLYCPEKASIASSSRLRFSSRASATIISLTFISRV